MFDLNPHSGSPLYRQLMEQIQRMVASGQLRPGDTLPSVRELALEHAVNPMTISKAYSLLEAQALLERRRGRGMVVASQAAPTASNEERRQHLQEQVDQLLLAARQLELGREDILTMITETLDRENNNE